MDLSMISQYLIRPRLMAVPGVANAAIWGQRRKQIMIEGDPAELAKYHISLGEVMAVAANAVDTTEVKYVTGAKVGSLGYIDAPNQRVYLRDIQPIKTPAQMAAVPVTQSGKGFVRIGQLASVVWGYPPLIGDAVINGQPGEMIVVEKFPGANTLQVTNGVLAALKQLAPGLKGINVDPNIFRQASFIQLAIHNLTLSVLLGCILGGVRPVRVPASSGAATLISLLKRFRCRSPPPRSCLRPPGATVNTMILAGFAVAVGVVVDDAILDMENIIRRLRAWRAARQASDAFAPGAGGLAGGPGRDLLRHLDQHCGRGSGHAGRRADWRFLPAAGVGLRHRSACLDAGGADRDTRAGLAGCCPARG